MTFAPLNTTWFSLIGLLWAGYFFLEGFDFGVSVVTPFVSRDGLDRRICWNSIGPVWDGNEVWLIVAGGATFAAFPLWYARLFSGFYLALFLVLLALIVRGVSFEFRARVDSPRWQRLWDVANFGGSLVAAVVWGVAFTNLVLGVPLTPAGRYEGGLPGLLHPLAILGGLAALFLFAFHGSLFLSLKTTGGLAARASRSALLTGSAAVVLLAGSVAWVAADGRPPLSGELPGAVPLAFALASLAALAGALVLTAAGRSGYAFGLTGSSILLAVGAVFGKMFPAVLPASNRAANSITIGAAASQHTTLVVMTVVAAIFTPLVLAYQAWTYWVFRQRLTRPPVLLAGEAPPSSRPGGGGMPERPAAPAAGGTRRRAGLPLHSRG